MHTKIELHKIDKYGVKVKLKSRIAVIPGMSETIVPGPGD
jgi:hypothetical protein